MRKTPLARRTPLRSRRAPKRTRRPAAETVRIYGSAERIEWMHRRPCCVTGIPGDDIHIVHVKTGGTGRKANAEWTVPMYGPLHQMLHVIGIRSFEARYNIDLELAAIATEQAWQAYQARFG